MDKISKRQNTTKYEQNAISCEEMYSMTDTHHKKYQTALRSASTQ